MHKGIGLAEFNALPPGRAVHALYECCGNVTWARKIAAARPFASQAELIRLAERELTALSPGDLERAFPGPVPDPETVAELGRHRLAWMLGPADGYPEY
ncbi:2-oxo-4-hydroxy-4-carboxy-5-ureidoimidazoline decarboxylase [Skermania piniformis]